MSIQDVQKQLGVIADGIWGGVSHTALIRALRGGKQIKLSDSFYLSELLASQTAERNSIDNTPTPVAFTHLVGSVDNLWQPVRELLGVPMLITSGYRGEKLNALVGGKPSSAHQHGYAIDFHAPKFGSTRDIVKHLAGELPKRGIKFDQLIIEYPNSPNSWVHLAWKNQYGLQRGQVFRIG